MIAYFHTSALIPLIVEEGGSIRAGDLWDQSERVVSVRVVYAEARAALALAARLGRFEPRELGKAVTVLEGLYAQLDLVGVDDLLVRRAGDLAQDHALRGYDAIHLAAAQRIADEETVLVAGDRRLCLAARDLGIAVADTSMTEPDE